MVPTNRNVQIFSRPRRQFVFRPLLLFSRRVTILTRRKTSREERGKLRRITPKGVPVRLGNSVNLIINRQHSNHRISCTVFNNNNFFNTRPQRMRGGFIIKRTTSRPMTSTRILQRPIFTRNRTMKQKVGPLGFIIRDTTPPPPKTVSGKKVNQVRRPCRDVISMTKGTRNMNSIKLSVITGTKSTKRIRPIQLNLNTVTVNRMSPGVTLRLFSFMTDCVGTTRVRLLIKRRKKGFSTFTIFIRTPTIMTTLRVLTIMPTTTRKRHPIKTGVTGNGNFTLINTTGRGQLIRRNFNRRLTPL